jgi:hypothetical protein
MINLGVPIIVRPVCVSCLFPVVLVSLGEASAQPGLQLFHEMQSALGGAQAISKIQDFDEVVRAETWDRQGRPLGIVRKRVRWKSPNYLRIDQSGPYDTYVLFFDGAAGWEIMPDKSVKNLSGGELTFARNYLRGLDFNLWLSDRDSKTVFSSPAPNTIVVLPGVDKSQSITVTLDPSTRLPVKQESISHSDPNHPVPAYTIPDRWRTINGVKIPGRIRNFHEGRMLAEITVETMQINLAIEPSILSMKPSDLKPVISAR